MRVRRQLPEHPDEKRVKAAGGCRRLRDKVDQRLGGCGTDGKGSIGRCKEGRCARKVRRERARCLPLTRVAEGNVFLFYVDRKRIRLRANITLSFHQLSKGEIDALAKYNAFDFSL